MKTKKFIIIFVIATQTLLLMLKTNITAEAISRQGADSASFLRKPPFSEKAIYPEGRYIVDSPEGIDVYEDGVLREHHDSMRSALAGKTGRISNTLKDKLDLAGYGEKFKILIQMNEKADVFGFRHLKRRERGRRVINELKSVAAASQEDLVIYLETEETKARVKNIKKFWIVNMIACMATKDVIINKLSRRPDVGVIYEDKIIPPPEPVMPSGEEGSERGGGTPPGTLTWGLERINAPALWSLGYDGSGVIIGSLDTGVYANHPDLAGKMAVTGDGSAGWYDVFGLSISPVDDIGHGTHTIGTMVGGNSNTSGIKIGVAPGATYYSVRIFRNGAVTYNSDILDGAQWMMDPDSNAVTADYPDIINNSWGSTVPGGSDEWFRQMVNNWRALDIIPVFATGNLGPGSGTVSDPGNYPESFGVGATDITDTVASFSSRGPAYYDGAEIIKPDISAPGVYVISAYAPGTYPPYLKVGPDLIWLNGTSMAAPHTAGACALLRQMDPNYTIEDVTGLLSNTADDIGESVFAQGNGRLDLTEIAGAQAIFMPRFSYFEAYDESALLWTGQKTVTMRNLTQNTLTYNLSTGTLPNNGVGITVDIAPSAIILPSLGSPSIGNMVKRIVYDSTNSGDYGWYAANVWDDTNFLDISEYSYLSFIVKGDQGGEDFYVQLQYGAPSGGGAPLSELHSSQVFTVTTDWQEVHIPLSSFAGLDLTQMRAVSIVFNGGLTVNDGIVYLDDLRFSREPVFDNPLLIDDYEDYDPSTNSLGFWTGWNGAGPFYVDEVDQDSFLLTITVDNIVLPDVPAEPYMHQGEVVAQPAAGGGNETAYFLFEKATTFTLSADTPWDYFIMHDRNTWDTLIGNNGSSTSAFVNVPHQGDYDIIVVFKQDGGNTRRLVIREGIPIYEDTTITVSVNEATHPITIDAVDINGNSVPPATRRLTLRYTLAPFGLAFEDNGFVNNYFISDTSNSYVLDWAEGNYVNGDFYCFNDSHTGGVVGPVMLTNTPAELKHLYIKFNNYLAYDRLYIKDYYTSWQNWLDRNEPADPFIVDYYFCPQPRSDPNPTLDFWEKYFSFIYINDFRLNYVVGITAYSSPFITAQNNGNIDIKAEHGGPVLYQSHADSTLFLGFGPPHFAGRTENSDLGIVLKGAPGGVVYYNQMFDVPAEPNVNIAYELYSGSTLMQEGLLNYFPVPSWEIYASPASYTLVLTSQYLVAGMNGQAVAELQFNTANAVDKNPPYLTGLRVESNGNTADSLDPMGVNNIIFKVEDDSGAVQQADLFYRIHGNSTWTSLAVSLSGGEYTALLPALAEDPIDIKIAVSDIEGNSLTCELAPAFYVGANPMPNRRPLAFVKSITPNPIPQVGGSAVLEGKAIDADGAIDMYNWIANSAYSWWSFSESQISLDNLPGYTWVFFNARDGGGIWSDMDVQLVWMGNNNPPRPEYFEAVPQLPDTISLNWGYAGGAPANISGYKIYCDTDGLQLYYDFVQHVNFVDAGNVNQYDLTQLAPDTDYYIGVSAYDSSGGESFLSDIEKRSLLPDNRLPVIGSDFSPIDGQSTFYPRLPFHAYVGDNASINWAKLWLNAGTIPIPDPGAEVVDLQDINAQYITVNYTPTEDLSPGWYVYYLETTDVSGNTSSITTTFEVVSGCFLAGMPVLMSNGTTTPIEELKVGDTLMAFDEDTGLFKHDKVKHVFVIPEQGEYLIINGRIKVTPHHNFYVRRKTMDNKRWTIDNSYEWVEAGKLKLGDILLNAKGEHEPVITIEKKEETVTVYNLEVNPYNTFIAGGVVVHNAKKSGDIFIKRPPNDGDILDTPGLSISHR